MTFSAPRLLLAPTYRSIIYSNQSPPHPSPPFQLPAPPPAYTTRVAPELKLFSNFTLVKNSHPSVGVRAEAIGACLALVAGPRKLEKTNWILLEIGVSKVAKLVYRIPHCAACAVRSYLSGEKSKARKKKE